MALVRWRTPAALTVVVLTGTLTACGDGGEVDAFTLGYFPNITHAPALVGVEQGTFADALGEDVAFDTQTFNAGPDAINALFSGEVDATFIGPNPAINGWAESEGTALRIVAGSTSRGGALVTQPDITSVEDLEGATLSTPQLGNTQDVALRYWAAEQGWDFDTEGGGDISIVPQENPEIISAFVDGEIDGAWVPEPHASRLVLEGDGNVLVDETDEWPDTDGEFVTTHLIVNADFLDNHPEAVERLVAGHVETVDWINDNPAEARDVANTHFEALSGAPLNDAVLESAFDNLEFTVDPIADSLRGSAEHAEEVGLLDPVDLDGIYALDPLNTVLDERGDTTVAGFSGSTG
ncbi:ABC transporter substrate-binding protein [Spiractinospora alimapuensis]|uniref:ABC transporter substrate-binding protein n=1 Tax=Spiractinospora alimapuensis TaxID=2820884 RepID=UPI001F34F063|nr:ABC transporter substrate-binding protein [Spiractinospora alimapuensis]QVQ50041.1 ABC transporter substrate-binding protein [Spiractinospora alimapuensis]